MLEYAVPGTRCAGCDILLMSDAHTYVEVALPLPIYRTFTYAVDRAFEHPLVPGARVLVPVRRRQAVGICVKVDVAPVPGRTYKSIVAVPDPVPALPRSLLDTCSWIARHYAAPSGIVLRSALPALLTGAATPVPRQRVRRILVLEAEWPSLMERDRVFRRAPRQRQVFELLESLGGRVPVDHLVDRLQVSAGVVDALIARGAARIEQDVVARTPMADRRRLQHPEHRPTAAQRAAIDAIVAGSPGDVFLLRGVTGSGKTLVYLDVLRDIVLARGRSAIVLVPEIALTPQTVDRFRSVFGDLVAVLHSALGDGERWDEWRALRDGRKRIAVGARSALFAPLDDVGVVVVDEEHEASYKQAETPRYHARDAAVVRSRAAGGVAVLGSATPSLESWTRARDGTYRLLELPERVGGGRLPVVHVIDRRQPDDGKQPPADAFRRLIAEPLERGIQDRLARREQSLLLLNRRGYASFLLCSACGDVASCPHCNISLTYHRTPERLACHYCSYQEAPRRQCARCGAATIRERGFGTQQVERVLGERFPAARIARMDVDTTSAKSAHADILDRVAAGDVDVLLGTQMIAKGLDFPNVTLVGVVDADVGINLPDFRASERTFQLLAQVAGRAGRGPKGGNVYIQTRHPGHHAVRCAITHDVPGFLDEELEQRNAPPYPPLVRLANVLISGTAETAVADLAQACATWLGGLLARYPDVRTTVVGPAPCHVDRIKDRWRWHLLLKSASDRSLTRVITYLVTRFPVPPRQGLRVSVDRDPVTLL
ncbi:MAG: Primosomal protein N' [Gemmatimonadaceae bacterium]|nr:Primosomal protein N' [Gemmatimonadaceae bacterium]